MELCPCFLEDYCPDFATSGCVGKARHLSFRIAWYIIVNEHLLLFAVDKEIACVYSGWVDRFCSEQVLNLARDLCKRINTRDKVAVSNLALPDVSRFNRLFEKLHSAVLFGVNIAQPAPLH